MINLKLLNKGLNGVLTPSEFMVLYIIENGIGNNNEPKKLYREMIADKSGLSVKQVTRLTNSLEEKKFIIKHQSFDPKTRKKECKYSINLSLEITTKEDKNVQKNTSNLDTNVPTKRIIKNRKKIINNISNNNDNNIINNDNKNNNNDIIDNFNKTIILDKILLENVEEKNNLEEGLRQWCNSINNNYQYAKP